jgi:hypothetical protein
MLRTTIIIAAGLAVAATLPAVPAQALTSRAWVSGKGTDAPSCGGVGTPCRTPQYAHDNIVAAGGEIDILDPAGYGAITITKAINIVNDGVGTAGMLAPAAGNAITINAGASDAIQLRGLTIEGSGVGYNGIVFNTGGSLTVTDCTVQNFAYSGSGNTTGNGILIEPTIGTFQFVITDTHVSNNAYSGIFYLPPSGDPFANIIIDHVVATANVYGIQFNSVSATKGTTVAAISNSIASDSNQVGIYAINGANLSVAIDNTSIVGNQIGIYTSGTPKILLGRSVITGNITDGVSNNTLPNTFYTYQNNQINLNGTDIAGALNTTFGLQ